MSSQAEVADCSSFIFATPEIGEVCKPFESFFSTPTQHTNSSSNQQGFMSEYPIGSHSPCPTYYNLDQNQIYVFNQSDTVESCNTANSANFRSDQRNCHVNAFNHPPVNDDSCNFLGSNLTDNLDTDLTVQNHAHRYPQCQNLVEQNNAKNKFSCGDDKDTLCMNSVKSEVTLIHPECRSFPSLSPIQSYLQPEAKVRSSSLGHYGSNDPEDQNSICGLLRESSHPSDFDRKTEISQWEKTSVNHSTSRSPPWLGTPSNQDHVKTYYTLQNTNNHSKFANYSESPTTYSIKDEPFHPLYDTRSSLPSLASSISQKHTLKLRSQIRSDSVESYHSSDSEQMLPNQEAKFNHLSLDSKGINHFHNYSVKLPEWSSPSSAFSPVDQIPPQNYCNSFIKEKSDSHLMANCTDSLIMPPPSTDAAVACGEINFLQNHQQKIHQNHSWHSSIPLISRSSSASKKSNSSITDRVVILRKKRGRPIGSKNKPKDLDSENLPRNLSPFTLQKMPSSSEILEINSDNLQESESSGNNTGKSMTISNNGSPLNSSASSNSNPAPGISLINSSPMKRPAKNKPKSEHIAVNTTLSVDPRRNEQLGLLPTKQSIFTGSSSKGSMVKGNREANVQKKAIGPYVHMEKEKGDRILFSIVNNVTTRKSLDEKEGKKNLSSKAPMRRPSFMNVYKKKSPASTIPQLASPTKDTTWICTFCKQGSHFKGLGDLFGPYFVHVEPRNSFNTSQSSVSGEIEAKVEPLECSTSLHSPKKSMSDKRKRSESSESILEKKIKTSSHSPNHATNDEIISEMMTSNNLSTQEAWFHEDCLVWSNGVFLAGNRIRNLEDVVSDCAETICCRCKLKGASLGCLHKGCSPRFHYLCAKEKGCEMNEENFSIYCSRHRRKSKDLSNSGSSTSPV